jgi:hypothetical protein
MNMHLPNGAAGFFPAPTNHIAGDPTPLDEAVYVPSVSPGYAIAAHEQDWKRPLPDGVNGGDLNFLDPANPLFRISHVMSSAGQALNQRRPCIIQARDRKATMMIADSGGYQIASGRLQITEDKDRLKILRWLEQHADWAMTLDVPTGPLEVKTADYKYKSFNDCLDATLDHLAFFQKHRKPGQTKFLNVLQGNDTRQSDKWFDAVKGFEFEGWAFAGKLRHNMFNLCRRIIKMSDQKLLQDRNWIHILGTNNLETAVGLTALQRAINLHINPHLRISYDTSTAFRMLSWSGVYSLPRFDRKGMTLPTTKCPNTSRVVGVAERFPWPSPLGNRLTLGDLCVRHTPSHGTYRDVQADHYLAHHNLASLCFAVSTANRIFDSESLLGQHTIATDMARAVKSIEKVIKTGTLTELENHRSVFNRIRKVEEPAEYEGDRDTLD